MAEGTTPAPAGQQPKEPTPAQERAAQAYDVDTLIAAAPSYADPDETPVRTYMVEGALRLHAHENDIKDWRDVTLTRKEMLAALKRWRERPDPTYAQGEAG